MNRDEDLHDQHPEWPDEPVSEGVLHPDHEPVVDEHPEKDVVTFADIVRRQFMDNRVAVFALRSVQMLILLATVAPLIALNVPYVMVTDAGLELPIFERMFDRLTFKGGVDIFFNLLLVLGPAFWLSGRFARAVGLSGDRASMRGNPAVWGGLLVAYYAFFGLLAWKAHPIYLKLIGIAAGATFLILVGALSARRLTPRDKRRRANQVRVIVALGFAAAFTVLQLEWKYTKPSEVFRYRVEKEDVKFSLSPPIFFHPDNASDDNALALNRSLKPPSISARHLLGTDANGRDVFSRMLYGTRISLTIGIIAVSIYVTIGIILGSIAGYFGGKVDLLIMFVLQVLICIPTLFLLLTIIALFDQRSIFLIMLAIGLTSWTGVTRLVRGEFFRQRSIEYVAAAKCLGVPERRIIFSHILKNSIGPVLVAAAFGVAGAILTESFLSFLGLGDTNAPSWGQILAEGRDKRKNWLIFSPGIAIFFVVTVLNIVGEGLRDALDPKLRT
ncbi:MAG: ABC transporter permease [Planctomycetota bacterium]